MANLSAVRPSPIAGTWYNANPQRLSLQIDEYLDSAHPPRINGEVLALIAPHAGHRYSGKTAAHAFQTVRGQSRDLVAVVSPMHAPAAHPLLTTAHAAYATPLGVVEVDQAASGALERALAESSLTLAKVARDQEHSLEIELPFLQRALLGEFRLLPVMVHTHSQQVCQALGEALARVLAGQNYLLVASTDLSHFYPQPLAERLDAAMLRCFEQFNPPAIFALEESGKGFACGAPAVAAVLWAARALGADAVQVLHYSTSAEETGDPSAVVGYGAAAVIKTALALRA